MPGTELASGAATGCPWRLYQVRGVVSVASAPISETALEDAKEQMVFRADVAQPVVLSKRGALYHPERFVPKALYSIHHQKSPFT